MSIEKLTKIWNKSGIKSGDTVLIHSSLKRTMVENKLSPDEILESFINTVGENGTLLFPLFNFDFCSGKAFDIRSTPSHMGALTESARKHPNAVRTGHPVYSFAIIGKKAKDFTGLCNISAYGSGSPFTKLHEMDGKIAILDAPDQNSMTFYHHVEEIMQVPYRFPKKFKGEYTDYSGETEIRRFIIYVRDSDKGVETYVSPMQEILWDEGLYFGDRPKENSGLRTVSARKLFDRVKSVIESRKAKGILYRINKK